MTDAVLAFDTIAPMIGGVVLTGACGFFGGLLLARRQPPVEELRFTEPIAGNELTKSRFTQETGDVDRAELLFEERLFRSGEIASVVLDCLIANPSLPPDAIAAIVEVEAEQLTILAVHGTVRPTTRRRPLSPQLLQKLATDHQMVLHREDDSSSLFLWLNASGFDTLYLTSIPDDELRSALIVTSFPWPAGLTEVARHRLSGRLIRLIGRIWSQRRQTERQAIELRTIREMLELRNIIDTQAEEPIEVLTQFADRLCELVKADRAAIYFVARRAGEKLQPIVQCGRSLSSAIESTWNRHEQALAHVAIESELGGLHDGNWLRHLQSESLINSAIAVPLRVNGRVLGALCMTRQDSDESLEPGRKLVDFSAEILSQTLRRVFDEATIRRQARHDHLTDLVNRRSFDAYLEAEIERVQHGEAESCSLILADLDHFKSCNDRFGHQAGDHVLRETARVLSEQVSCLRMGENSVVARYGGEEFAILLPGIGEAGAMRIAEAIRDAIEKKSIRVQSTTLRITVSLGVAVCPIQAHSPESLIAAADKALYQAKYDGRNRVCRATGSGQPSQESWRRDDRTSESWAR